MTQAKIAERGELHELIDDLREENAEKIFSYAAFLRHVERQEDEEDIKSYFERKDEPTYTMEEVKRDLGID